MSYIPPYTYDSSGEQYSELEIKEKEKLQKQRLHRARTAAMLISFVAVVAILVAVYAFKQKKEADNQTSLAKQKTVEALLLQKIALEQRNIADSNKEQASQQRELALESEKRALLQKQIAEAETRKAEENRLKALQQQYLAEEQKAYAEKQKIIAESNAREAVKQQTLAEVQKGIAKVEKQTSNKLKELTESRNIANESVLLLNENRVDSSKSKALLAYKLNEINNGPGQSNDIYNALNINWVNSINYKNQSNIHKLPVRCITGMPGNNIIFTADESGILYESVIKSNGLQKIASYTIKDEVRALSVSRDGTRLVAITASGNGIVFTISSSKITVLTSFKFAGTGKAVIFNGTESFFVLSSKGIGKYEVTNIEEENFLSGEGINAFAIGKTGKFYIASGNQVKIYNDWNDLMHNSLPVTLKFDSQVSSLSVDKNEQYIAAGTYNGFVWINDLKNNNAIWNRALHLSSVNDLKFATVDDNKLQLASGGADQTIKLIDVKAIFQKTTRKTFLR